MAIDTENKRRSTLCVLPKPDGAISLLDRMQVCWLYAGIEEGEVVEANPICIHTLGNHPALTCISRNYPSVSVESANYPAVTVYSSEICR